jgi:hypothetical protein
MKENHDMKTLSVSFIFGDAYSKIICNYSTLGYINAVKLIRQPALRPGSF